ncbi:MAG: hypothetical protein HLUCCA11_23235 [Phormidesmis priestleyi Ana]|uniref:Uncharacterized protein n=1 Tax=Phormidesmis priestleyi Ana TaxID=1666911 RepID=A0A0P7YP12_9CYAN|nr:MAG: hypothetical protein HLUCCA11_23235 [Phormidesmis priestleyi Ana]
MDGEQIKQYSDLVIWLIQCPVGTRKRNFETAQSVA